MDSHSQMSSDVSISSYHSFHRQNKKRKANIMRNDTDAEDESETCSSLRTVTPTDDNSKKQNHSEIEKRRRDKMNTFITELSGMVPMCSAMSRKLDKLTVLRMAVQHMKTLRGSRFHSYTEGHYKPSFVTDQELFQLILKSADGFLFVVGCDRGRLLYVSESVFRVLKFSQKDLLGQSWFDILHPKDVAKVKEQLSSSDVAPRERLIDAKTMLPVKASVPQRSNRLCPGARRSFFCRMKVKAGNGAEVKEEGGRSHASCHRKKKSERKYAVVHCTGYLKSWAKVGMEESEGDMEDACNLSCLVAVGRILPPITQSSMWNKERSVSFVSRHTVDGRFLFVDQRATLILGFLPQELLGSSMYEYLHSEDLESLAEAHKAALELHEDVRTGVYQFRTRSCSFVKLNTSFKAFRNPWTKDIEYLIARNTFITGDSAEGSRAEAHATPELDFYPSSSGAGRDIQRLIGCHMEASNIGKLIANQMDPGAGDSSASNSPEVARVGGALGGAGAGEGGGGGGRRRIPATDSLMSPEHCSSSQSSLFPSASTSVSMDMDVNCHNHSLSCQRSPVPRQDDGDIDDGAESELDSGAGRLKILHGGDVDGTELYGAKKCPSKAVASFPPGPAPISVSVPTLPPQGLQSQLSRASSQSSLDEGTIGGSRFVIGNDILDSIPHRPNQPIQTLSSLPSLHGLHGNTNHNNSNEGNDEAAMAVIMSLLEADAGLGGPVDFTGLPWPLP